MRGFTLPHFKRKLTVVAIISLLLASALELYTFGLDADFLLRWLRTFFVVLVLLAATVLAIVPGVNYLVSRVAGR